ncbi:hypothetical protein SCLCIDRAFT_1208528 [Scleroderma citrinum Foug A]|uniref:Uncharacterized protein n=1 Tax=Scleroderma citrinum Foug A TaxID=1036808 RepID=A0A0C3E8Q1_9AGAM|nr:hypothetical protein SCLCIDRAFT_1208528 [Scleroderma citrinum Foug A]
MYRPFLIDTISAHAMDHRIVKPTIALVGGLTSLWMTTPHRKRFALQGSKHLMAPPTTT